MQTREVKIAISAGELSGDEHAALVVQALKKQMPNAVFRGMGGKKLRAVGVDTIVDCETSGNVMGFKQVIAALPKILGAIKEIKSLLLNWKPDLLIVVDYPDFHFRIIRYAKKLNIPVLYFIPPSVWAWREGRIKTLHKCADKLALIYPFEKEFYKSRGVDQAEYVGHPFSTSLPLSTSAQERIELRKKLGIANDARVVALFPGSRRAEITRHMSVICKAFEFAQAKHPEIQGLIAVAPSLGEEFIRQHLPPSLAKIAVSTGNSIDILRATDAGILKSGTSNLQAAFIGLPFVMMFMDSKVAKFIVDNFVKLKQYSIVNIIRPNSIKEFATPEPNPEAIGAELCKILFEGNERSEMIAAFDEIKSALCSGNQADKNSSTPYSRVAEIAIALISKTST